MVGDKFVYMTVLTNAKYIPGVKALKKSLMEVGSIYRLAVLIPSDIECSISKKLNDEKIFDDFCFKVEKEPNEVLIENLQNNHYWNNTFFKLVATNCIEFNKIILLDSDMLILNNIDRLFDAPTCSAVIAGKAVNSDWTRLNSGLMVIEPDIELYNNLISNIEPTIIKRKEKGFSCGDQDVFQETLERWTCQSEKHLPEIFNCFYNSIIDVARELNCSIDEISVVHFVGKYKPWEMKGLAPVNIYRLFKMLTKGHISEMSIYLKYIKYCK